MKKTLILVVVVSVLLFSGFAGWYLWSQRPAQKLVGSWGNVSGPVYVFRSDGTFTQHFASGGRVPAQGQYRLLQDGWIEMEFSNDEMSKLKTEGILFQVRDFTTGQWAGEHLRVRRFGLRFETNDRRGDRVVFITDENNQDFYDRMGSF